MSPSRLITTVVLALLSAFAHAAKVGELPAATTTSAPRIAVYLDCSNSMAPYLSAVEAEVRKQFPDADVFSIPHIKVWVDGTVVRGGATSVLAHRPPATGPRVSVDASRMTGGEQVEGGTFAGACELEGTDPGILPDLLGNGARVEDVRLR